MSIETVLSRIDFPFFFLPRCDILVEGYTSLDRNSVRCYLLFRTRDTTPLGALKNTPVCGDGAKWHQQLGKSSTISL